MAFIYQIAEEDEWLLPEGHELLEEPRKRVVRVRQGKRQVKRLRTSKRKIRRSPKQKAALRKSRRFSNRPKAKKKRKRSFKVRKRLNLSMDNPGTAIYERLQDIDSEYLQRQLQGEVQELISDLEFTDDHAQAEAWIEIVEWLGSRVMQSYPDGDVSFDMALDVIDDPRIRKALRAVPSWKRDLAILWKSIR